MEAVTKLEIGKIYWIRVSDGREPLPESVKPGLPVELLAAWDTCLFVRTALGKIVAVPRDCLEA